MNSTFRLVFRPLSLLSFISENSVRILYARENAPLTVGREQDKVRMQGVLGNQFRFQTTETGTETSFGAIRNAGFGCFTSIPKQRVSVFRLNRNKQKTNPNSFIESVFQDFSENFGLFQFVSKQFCLFQLFRYRFETPKQLKQTKILVFGFTKQTRNTTKTDLVSVCLGKNRKFFGLFRERPSCMVLWYQRDLIHSLYLATYHPLFYI